MILPLDEIGQFPISLIIIAIIINGIYNHSIYKFIVTFLFEKGLTNRQKRAWRKEKERLLTPPLTFAPGRFFLIHSTARIKSSPYPLCSSIPVAIANTFGSKMIPFGSKSTFSRRRR